MQNINVKEIKMNAEQERTIRRLERQRDACHKAHRDPAPIICPICGKETSIEDLAEGRTVYVKNAAGREAFYHKQCAGLR